MGLPEDSKRVGVESGRTACAEVWLNWRCVAAARVGEMVDVSVVDSALVVASGGLLEAIAARRAKSASGRCAVSAITKRSLAVMVSYEVGPAGKFMERI